VYPSRAKCRAPPPNAGGRVRENAVYALPAGKQAQEDFQWLLKEISEGGGEGMICETRLIEGLSDDDVRELFQRDLRC
jgi:hypothetical protein